MGVASGNAPFTWHGLLPATGRGLSVSALKGCSSAPLAFLFWCVGSSRSPELLRCLRNSLWSGGLIQFVTLPGLSLWFFRTCLRFSWNPFLGVLGVSMLCLFLALFPGARLWCPLLSSLVLWRTFRPLPYSSVCRLYCTCPTNARQSHLETVISCAGGQGFLVRFGFASSAMRAVPFLPHGVTRRSYRRPLSPSGSGCRCHGSAASRPRNGLFHVRWARYFRVFAPSLLCEELCCHPGGGARVCSRALPCVATWGLPLLSCLQASTGSVW